MIFHQHIQPNTKQVYDQLSVIDDKEFPLLVLDDSKVVVPKEGRNGILKKLHIPHCGVTKTWQTAGKRYYWPAMGRNIAQMCEACQSCRETLPSRGREPMINQDTTPMEELEPMEEIGIDFMEVNR